MTLPVSGSVSIVTACPQAAYRADAIKHGREWCVRLYVTDAAGEHATCVAPGNAADDGASVVGPFRTRKEAFAWATEQAEAHAVETHAAAEAARKAAAISARNERHAEILHSIEQESEIDLDRALCRVWDFLSEFSVSASDETFARACALRDRMDARRDAERVLRVLEKSPAMVQQPCQQQQARARGRAPQPARGERRYVTVRDTETGDVHRVLTSVAQVGVAVVIFTPSNRHRQGALGGMLITHDDIRKAWVFNDVAEARRMLSRNRAPGERVIRAELVADPAPAIVPLGGRYVALADGGVEWVADAPTMVPQPAQQQQAKAGATLSDAPKDEQFADAARAKLGDSDGFEVDADAAVSRGSGEPGGAFVACWVWVSNDEASA